MEGVKVVRVGGAWTGALARKAVHASGREATL